MLPPSDSEAERALCARQLRGLFGDLQLEIIDGILNVAGVHTLEAGETLFAQGDPPGPMYIVLTGRLRAIARLEPDEDKPVRNPDDADRFVVLGDIAAGEPVGEMALFTREPRIASVVALRLTRLLCITAAHHLQLVSEFPLLVLTLNQFLVRRLRRNQLSTRSRALPRNVAVVNLCRRTDLPRWLEAARLNLGEMGINTRLVHRPANGQGSDVVLDEETAGHREDMNVLLCDPAANDWTRACLLNADIVVLAVDFGDDPALRPLESELGLHTNHLLRKRLLLLLVHPADAPAPVGTARWLASRRGALHVHVREDRAADRRRFCRILTNRAVGLVLGGGGARGHAHFGAVRALMDDGLEVDFLGGTSAGALYGALMSIRDFNWDSLAEIGPIAMAAAPTSRDYTLPFLALMSGHKMRRLLRQGFGDAHLEDLWTNTFCVSSNYSTASAAVHDHGLARERIEASIAIPGVFPPVLLDGQLHVDGGLFDNLPIAAMLARPVSHVVAISLMAQAPHGLELTELPTTRQLFWNWVTRRRQFGLPSTLPAFQRHGAQQQAPTHRQHRLRLVILGTRLARFRFAGLESMARRLSDRPGTDAGLSRGTAGRTQILAGVRVNQNALCQISSG